jgi:MFS family permease
MQVFLIACTNFINSVAYLVTFPLVPFMVLSFFPPTPEHPGLSETEIGYYSGMLEGSFHAGAFLGAFFWGWAADRFGRKPVLQWGLLGTAVSSVAFGFSSSLPQALATKFIWGMLNGVRAPRRLRPRAGARPSGRIDGGWANTQENSASILQLPCCDGLRAGL